VLRAVVRELEKKAAKASTLMALADPRRFRDGVIEVEQAADSAKIAAEADPHASGATKTVVLGAHQALCMMKAELG
jgi:hypothetical protein